MSGEASVGHGDDDYTCPECGRSTDFDGACPAPCPGEAVSDAKPLTEGHLDCPRCFGTGLVEIDCAGTVRCDVCEVIRAKDAEIAEWNDPLSKRRQELMEEIVYDLGEGTRSEVELREGQLAVAEAALAEARAEIERLRERISYVLGAFNPAGLEVDMPERLGGQRLLDALCSLDDDDQFGDLKAELIDELGEVECDRDAALARVAELRAEQDAALAAQRQAEERVRELESFVREVQYHRETLADGHLHLVEQADAALAAGKEEG